MEVYDQYDLKTVLELGREYKVSKIKVKNIEIEFFPHTQETTQTELPKPTADDDAEKMPTGDELLYASSDAYKAIQEQKKFKDDLL